MSISTWDHTRTRPQLDAVTKLSMDTLARQLQREQMEAKRRRGGCLGRQLGRVGSVNSPPNRDLLIFFFPEDYPMDVASQILQCYQN